MTFRRGASLPVAVSLGHAESCDLGPTAGNGFYKRWPDDLALLADLGVVDLRLTFDWARLQPKPGEFAGSWVERYENVFEAAQAIGISVWATMYDSGVPKWFVNEGGLDDDEAITRWWPRWVERVADHFGDRVDGWIPFAVIPSGLPDAAWLGTWEILGAGEPPVVASLESADGVGFVERHEGRFDRLGVALDVVNHDALDHEAERWGQALRDAAEAAPDTPLVVSRFTPDHEDPEVDARLVACLVEVLEQAIADGLDIETCLIEPAIAGHDDSRGLLDSDRVAQPAAEVFLIPPDDD